MKIRGKRIIASLLSMILLFSSLTAYAADDEGPDQGNQKDAEKYVLTVEISGAGTVDVSAADITKTSENQYRIAAGEEVNLSLNPGDGYELSGVGLNGEEVSDTFTMPEEDATLSVAFSAVKTVDTAQGDTDTDQEPEETEKAEEPEGTEEQESTEHQREQIETMRRIYESYESSYVKKPSSGQTLRARSVGESINSQVLESSVSSITVTQYPEGGGYNVLKTWSEGILGADTGERLYCADPTVSFQGGTKTAVPATNYFPEYTVNFIGAMMYWYDNNMCGGVNDTDDYLFKQEIVWTIGNMAKNWYSDVLFEHGNATSCNWGHDLYTHRDELFITGQQWAAEHINEIKTEAFVFEGDGQPLMRVNYSYNPPGQLSLKKTSANPELTNNNSCYSLNGAEYGVYSDEHCTFEVATLTTDSSGDSNTVDLNAGIYYVKEKTAPRGYALDTQVYEVTVTSAQPASLEVKDLPQSDPVTVLLGKIDAETTADMPQGSASLENAEFTVKFYGVLSDTDPAKQGETALRTWIVKTDSRGFTRLGDKYKVSGDEFYKLGGVVTLPLGTVTIQETKAPTGYLLNDEIFVRKITSDGTAERVNTYNEPEVPESVIRGGVRIEKWDNELASKNPQGAATLEGTKIQIVSENDSAVMVNGKSYSKGEIVKTLTTDKTGVASTAANELPYGDYIAREQAAPTGYNLSGVTEHKFSIRENGKLVDLNTGDTAFRDNVIRGGVRIEKWDNELASRNPQGTGTLENAKIQIISDNDNLVLVNGKTYRKGEVVKILTTDKTGAASTAANELPYGDYIAKEQTPPAGYNLSGVIERKFSIRENGKIVNLNTADTTIRDNVIRGGVRVEKRDNETGKNEAQGGATLEGAVFEIISRNDNVVLVNGKQYKKGDVVKTLTTDSTGTAQTGARELPHGRYLLKETKAPEGYNLSGVLEREFSITEDGKMVQMTSASTAIRDDVIRGDVQIVKFRESLDEDEDQKTPLDGIIFTFTSKTTGQQFEITTNEYGYANTKQLGISDRGNLVYDTYIVHESNTPEGLKPIKDFEVTISQEGQTLYYILEDKLILSPVQLYKSDATTNELIPMAGTEFQLLDKNKEPVTMTTHYPSTEVHYTFKTDKTGSFTLPEKLPAGTYYWREVNAPEGYLRGQDLKFEIKEGHDWSEPFIVEYADEPAMGRIEIIKVDAESGDVLAGAEFSIAAAEDIVTPDGTVRAVKGEVVDTITTDAFGRAQSKDLYLGKYDVVETKQPSGYVRPDQSWEVKLTYQDQDTAIVTETLRVENTPTVVIIDKKETGSETHLPDVAFRIWNKAMAEDEIDPGVAAGEIYVTDENGQISLERLEAGDYCVAEVKTVPGYSFDPEKVYEFTVTEDGRIDKTGEYLLTIENDRTEIVETNALSGDTGTQEAVPKKETRITDTVSLIDLQPGETYTLKGILMDTLTGVPVKTPVHSLTGDEITAEKTFTAEESTMDVEVTFIFDATDFAGRTVTVFERLYQQGEEISAHTDLKDEGQTVVFPEHKIHTEARDQETGTQEAVPKEQTTIVDTVSYSGLIAGQEYTLKGILMRKDTGEPLEVGGEQVTAEKTFTPEEAEGIVELEFTFDSSALVGKEVVVFERLYVQGTEVAVHTDIEDEGQTVVFPEHKIHTEARDQETGTQEAVPKEQTTIVDTVSYSGLIAGQEYTLKGILMRKDTGEPLEVGGEQVTAEKTFTPEEAEGIVELEFTFDSSALVGKEVVVFERLYVQGTEVAVHTDIEDEGQTVVFPEHKIHTEARDQETGTQEAVPKEQTTIVDTVSYSGLIAGQEYTLKGILMRKDTGEPLEVGGEQVTAEKTFTPEKPEGTVELEFTFDASGLNGVSVVVFERLYAQGTEVAAHTDLKDENQTVTFKVGGLSVDLPEGRKTVKTGDDTSDLILKLCLMISGAAILIVSALRSKRKKRKGEEEQNEDKGEIEK